MRLKQVVLAGIVLSLAALEVGCKKPCAPIQQSDTVKKLGFVLPGGNLCKDSRGAATVDYPDVSGSALQKTYQDAMTKSGWKVERATDYMLLATKDENLLLVTTGAKSKERHVPFAVVKYCVDDPLCSTSSRALFEASKKYAK